MPLISKLQGHGDVLWYVLVPEYGVYHAITKFKDHCPCFVRCLARVRHLTAYHMSPPDSLQHLKQQRAGPAGSVIRFDFDPAGMIAGSSVHRLSLFQDGQLMENLLPTLAGNGQVRSTTSE